MKAISHLDWPTAFYKIVHMPWQLCCMVCAQFGENHYTGISVMFEVLVESEFGW